MTAPSVPEPGTPPWAGVADTVRTGDASARLQALEQMLTALERLVVTDPRLATGTAEEVIDLVDDAGTLAMRLRARRLLAIAFAYTNQFRRSLDVCDEATHLPGVDAEPVELGRVRLASMQALASLDRIDDAISVGQDALALLEAHGGGIPARRAALNIGAVYAMSGRHLDALASFDRARADLRDDPVMLGQIESNRGTALAALDRFQEAERAFAVAADLLATDEMSWAAAIAEGNLADLAARQGAINRSLRHFEASRRHLERDHALGDLGRLNAEQAGVLAAMGLMAEARPAFVEALALLREHGSPPDLAAAEVAWATALLATGDLAGAESIIAETGTRLDVESQPDTALQFLALSARIALAQGDTDRAREAIARGLRDTADRPVQRLRWALLEAEAARQEGETPAARRMLHAAAVVAERSRVTPLLAEIHRLLAEIERDAGNTAGADAHARRAVDACEAIRGTLQADRLRQAFHHNRLDVYADLYLSLLAQAEEAALVEAFNVAERIRSRALLDAMHLRSTDDADIPAGAPAGALEGPLLERLAEDRRWLNWMYSQLADGHEPSDAQQRELEQREHTATILADRLALLRPQPGFDTPVSLHQVQADLAPTTAILAYLAVGGTMTLQVIRADAVHGVPNLASEADLAEQVANHQFQTTRALLRAGGTMSAARADRLRRDADVALARLHDLLIAPAARWLQGVERLIVIPSGVLHSVPFAALRHDGAYLIDAMTVVTSPSVSVLGAMRATRGRPDAPLKRPLVVGVPDDDTPGLGSEAERLGQRFAHATTLIGHGATRAAVIGAASGSDLVHLACHGRFDPAHPNASGLRLADGWLTLDRLGDLRVDRALVVLTGCETGRVRVDAGDDLVGMMAALLRSGAHGLVSSLWKTHDAAAAALVDAFYDAHARDGDAVAALAVSQREVRAHYAHPAYWAPFIVVQSEPGG